MDMKFTKPDQVQGRTLDREAQQSQGELIYTPIIALCFYKWPTTLWLFFRPQHFLWLLSCPEPTGSHFSPPSGGPTYSYAPTQSEAAQSPLDPPHWASVLVRPCVWPRVPYPGRSPDQGWRNSSENEFWSSHPEHNGQSHSGDSLALKTRAPVLSCYLGPSRVHVGSSYVLLAPSWYNSQVVPAMSFW